MLWFAVHLPWLSLEAFAAALDEAQRRQPLALLAEHEVQAVNAAAAAAGVRPGLKRATALALRPDLQFGQADERRDAQALQAVVHTALAFTPAVALDGHSVLLEVASCLRYFGGADALLAQLRQALQPLGHRLRIAAAPTALGAALLARWRDGLHEGPQRDDLKALQRLLDPAPVWLLGPGREHWQALQGMGLQRLSQLLALPRAGLARRFGEALLDELDRARGTRPDPRPWLSAPERFSARLELAQRAEHAEPLLHAAALLLQQLVAWARARQSRVLAFSLQMRHESRHRADDDAVPPATALRVELADASVDVAHLQLLLRERLTRVALPAPTLELQIDCHELRRQSAPNAELFPTRQSEQAGLQRLLERLRARLGDDRVLALQAVADHRPEKASVLVRAGAVPPSLPSSPPPPAIAPEDLLPHPVWLLPQPQPLAEREAMPLFQGRLLLLLSGPERIETGWWDGEAATRDYFIGQAADGALVWVFRQRLPVRDPAEPLWYLHGWYG
jgi:protein ImuB